MTPTRFLPVSLVLALATLGFVGMQPEAEAVCDVNIGGYCAGTCDANVVATCYAGGNCMVNALATCGDYWYGNWAGCTVNVGQAECADYGACFVNAGDASCHGGSCFVNAGMADCSGGWCAVNAGLASCTGGCLVNVGASCDSTACVVGTAGGVEPVCFLWGCSVNVALAECHETGRCAVNVASDCWGSCAANLASPSTWRGSVIIDLGCGEQGACLVNAASYCDGWCDVNAALARCETGSACLANVFATCSAFDRLLP